MTQSDISQPHPAFTSRRKKIVTNRQLSNLKGVLTRARKTGNDEAVLEAVAKAFAIFETAGYPDCWTLWESARTEAQMRRTYGMPK